MHPAKRVPVWFITGCSSGFGLSLALLALRQGHHVIATSRSPSSTPAAVAQVEKLGGKWMRLDVTASEGEGMKEGGKEEKEGKMERCVREAVGVWGGIDVLVNCAGYALLGAFESLSPTNCRAQMETNFFGPVALTRLLLPQMRERGSGVIVNMSSTAGIEAKPSRTMYCASKFALEAFSEALSEEVRPFGVRVLLVEPGAFRSQFSAKLKVGSLPTPKEYAGTITEAMVQGVRDMAGTDGTYPRTMRGDVEKGVQAIFDVVMREGQAEGMPLFLRLPLGKDNAARWEVKMENLKANLEGTRAIWENTDVDDDE